jgi:2-iminobutanoate/2-iminopropanoate deaminase
MDRSKINAADAIRPPAESGYSQAVAIAGFKRLVFVSGQVPIDPAGVVPAGFTAQLRQAWTNVEAQLRAAGMGLANIIKVTTFITDRAHAIETRTIRRQILGDMCPAATTVMAGLFEAEWLVEIEVVAAD